MRAALKSTFAIVLGGVCALVALTAQSNPVVTVTGGQMAGRPLTGGGAVFKGVPFARPPIGELRWREPAPVVPWTGVRDAGSFSPACVQNNQQNSEGSREDCLYLNVWTPEWPFTSPKAVMVWLHGGGNISGTGSSPQFDGVRLIAKGVVLVTINYRLGLLSFFAHPGLSAESPHRSSGNYGLLDQVAALKWVRDNIARFGGDPKRVTVFGESGGSIDAGLLLSSPLAKGLVSGIIQESGPPVVRGLPTLAKYEEFGTKVAADLKAPAARAEAVKFLRALPAEEILKTQVAILAQVGRAPMLGPIRANIDGYFLPKSLAVTLSTGQTLPVPLITGNNSREQLLVRSPEELKKEIADAFGPVAAKAEAYYGVSNGGKGNEDPLYGAADIRFSTDRWYRCGHIAEALWHSAQKHPVYQYQFDYAPPGREFTAHGAEVQYVFGTLRGQFTEVDRRLSDVMQEYWANFAKTGNPNGGNLVTWPRFDATKRGYLEFMTNGQSVAKEGLAREICDLYIDRLKLDAATH